MKNLFRNLYHNKVLVITSIVFFFVGFIAINLTLNLTNKPTNTSTQALTTESQCNQWLNPTDCSSRTPGCTWNTSTLYNCNELIIPDSITNKAAWCASYKNGSISCLFTNGNPPKCAGNYRGKCVLEPTPSPTPNASCSCIPELPCESYNQSTCNSYEDRGCVWSNGLNRCTNELPCESYNYNACLLYLDRGCKLSTNCPTPPGGGGTPPPGATATPTAAPTSPPNQTPCGCNEDNNPPAADGTFDNICDYPPNYCVDTIPGGFCDPDGNSSYAELTINDWIIGYQSYAALNCGTGGPDPTTPPAPTNSPPPGTTNTPVPTEVIDQIPTLTDMTHGCSADQSKSPSWDIRAEGIDTHGMVFRQAHFQFCMTPNRYENQRYLYVNFFNQSANYQSETTVNMPVPKPDGTEVTVPIPIWACYSFQVFRTLPADRNIDLTVNGDSILNFNGYTKTIAELADFTDNAKATGKISIYPEYDTKVVLISDRGVEYVGSQKNDQIVSREDPDNPNGHMKFHSTACSDNGEPTPTIDIPPSCSYVTETLTSTKYLTRDENDPNGVRNISQELDLADFDIDYSKPFKVGVDWGWTGKGTKQLGLVDLPGTEFDLPAGQKEQKNETSKVDISTINDGASEPTNIGTINCPDVGEYRQILADLPITYFADGRIINYQSDSLSISTNLKDPKRDGGSWYTCPITAGNRPLFSTTEVTTRPATEWKEFTIPDTVTKLRFDKEFTGNDTSNGSHFTRIFVSYCENPAENTPTPNP